MYACRAPSSFASVKLCLAHYSEGCLSIKMSSDKPWLSDPISIKKKELRKKVEQQELLTLSGEDQAQQSTKVLEKVLAAPWFKDANRISIYAGVEYGEIQTDEIVKAILDSGKTAFVPQFKKGTLTMKMLKVPSYEEYAKMEMYRFGIRQPKDEDNWEPYENTGPLDLVLLPGVAFTKNGDRLGHGMGHYDRMLADHKNRFGKLPKMYGLALTQQMVDSVPLSDTDIKLDGVICAE
ncbi:unnamed protein product [Cylicocyclus nassatus]|uniref:5-formyltetrahydrofolate cyclo-ligase n=1 Tax=Cylicocyclus nassatus TaxID=53992 RepID=A0AA36DUJ9_CYLNA|nr:unnamed protein product [Cylicocyclus nassatus]